MRAPGTALRGSTSGTIAPSFTINDRGRHGVAAKNCVVCRRSFTVRKKWERCWEEVTTCSKRCNTERRRMNRRAAKSASGSGDESSATRSGEQRSAQTPDPSLSARSARKAEKRRVKAERRSDRQGTGDPDRGRKSCDTCAQRCDLLVRCRVDASREWRMVCGSCWNSASGGVPDGDGDHPEYQYGGLWKNLHAAGRA